MYSWLKYRRVAGGLSSAGIDAMSTEGVDVRARRLLNRAAAGQETNGGVGVDAIDSRLELAIACRFATWVNSLEVAPQGGFEPPTLRLTAGCSAVELLRNTERRRASGRTSSVTDRLIGAQCPFTVAGWRSHEVDSSGIPLDPRGSCRRCAPGCVCAAARSEASGTAAGGPEAGADSTPQATVRRTKRPRADPPVVRRAERLSVRPGAFKGHPPRGRFKSPFHAR